MHVSGVGESDDDERMVESRVCGCVVCVRGVCLWCGGAGQRTGVWKDNGQVSG